MSEKLKIKDDIMFKAFFSRKENKGYLEEILSAILEQKVKISKVIHDARLEQLTREDKYGVLDLDVELEDGSFVNIEMQMQDKHNMEKRTTFYASKKISEQLRPKVDYKEIKQIIVIAILNYNMLEVPEYINKTVTVLDKHRDFEINNEIVHYYIELEKFRQSRPDMKEKINQWLAFVDMEDRGLLQMAEKANKKIKSALDEYEVLTGDEEIKRLAEVRLFESMAKTSALNDAKAEGRAEGEAIGIAKGEKSGQYKKTIEIAKKMLAKNKTIEEIMDLTELTKEEIEKLK